MGNFKTHFQKRVKFNEVNEKKKERETTIKEKWAGECQLIFLLKGWLSTGSRGIS